MLNPQDRRTLEGRHFERPEYGLAALTPREAEALVLLAEGRSNQEIADALGLILKSAENYVNSIYLKLGLDANESGSAKRVKASILYHHGTDVDAFIIARQYSNALKRLADARQELAEAEGQYADTLRATHKHFGIDIPSWVPSHDDSYLSGLMGDVV